MGNEDTVKRRFCGCFAKRNRARRWSKFTAKHISHGTWQCDGARSTRVVGKYPYALPISRTDGDFHSRRRVGHDRLCAAFGI